MRIVFLGCGEACDPSHPNTSVLIENGNNEVLLDCGFTVPHQYFLQRNDPESLQAVWLSHFHGDHYFGLPLVLLKLAQMGRKTPLHICGQKGVGTNVKDLSGMAYGSLIDEVDYEIQFIEMEPGQDYEVAGALWRTALTSHSRRSLAVRLKFGEKEIFYSGDGAVTSQSLELAKGCRLVIHESYRLHDQTPGHGTVKDSIELAVASGAGVLALVHLMESEREKCIEMVKIQSTKESLDILLPETGDIIEL